MKKMQQPILMMAVFFSVISGIILGVNEGFGLKGWEQISLLIAGEIILFFVVDVFVDDIIDPDGSISLLKWGLIQLLYFGIYMAILKIVMMATASLGIEFFNPWSQIILAAVLTLLLGTNFVVEICEATRKKKEKRKKRKDRKEV